MWNVFNLVLSLLGVVLNLVILASTGSVTLRTMAAFIVVILSLRAVRFGSKLTAPTTPSTPPVQDQPNKKES